MRKKFISLVTALVIVLSALAGAGCGGKGKPTVDPIDDNYRVFYQVFVGSYSDSNNDGIGDLRGLINRLDYLNDGDINSGDDLGVQGIWLSPVFTSPTYHKYDAADYYNVDRTFGTNADLEELIEKCHQRNVKVILDLVVNHTSTNHEWFKKFASARQKSESGNKYYDYYTCRTSADKEPGKTYAKVPGCSDFYYECNFDSAMPELNFDSEDVKAEILNVAKFWMDKGVDGFRFDAVKYIYYYDSESSINFWKWFMDELRKINPDVYTVGECWSGTPEILEYYDAINCFNFQMSQAEGVIAMAAKSDNINNFTNNVTYFLNKIEGTNQSPMFMPFISNHDMDRSAGYLMLSTRFAYMGANLLLLCSGSPFIYYGEEIGMKGTRGAAMTDANRRLAMLWGDGDTVKDPIGATFEAKKQTNGTVKTHLADENSLFHHYKKLIEVRNRHPEIARGKYTALSFNDFNVGGFVVTYEGSTIGIIHNNHRVNPITVDLKDGSVVTNFTTVADYVGQTEATLDGTLLTIGPQSSVILR